MARPTGNVWRKPRAVAAMLASVAGLGLAAAVVGAVASDGPPAPVDVRLVTGSTGRVVPPGFVGFSFEYGSIGTYFGDPARPNLPFVALMQSLSRAQHGPPAVRIGGNSADVSWWDPSGAAGPRQLKMRLGPYWMSSLTTLESRMRIPLTLTLNLALERPANALAFVQAAQSAVPPGVIRTLEIGNEPDLYSQRTPTAHGVLSPPRFPALHHYPPSRYGADVLSYAAAMTGGLSPRPALSAGGFAGMVWNSRLPGVLRASDGQIRDVSVHAYPLHGCHRGGRTHDTVNTLLSSAASDGLAARVSKAIRMAGVRPSAVRVGELNSVTCGGLRGISDRFASALWSTDALFEMLRLGVSGINIHTLTGAAYAPFTFVHSGPTGWRAQAQPLYYGLLLFAEAAPAGSHTVKVAQQPGSGLKTWATIDQKHTLRVTVINPSTTSARTVVLSARPAGGAAATPPAARVIRMRAPSAAARGGVTLGGEHVGADGKLHGTRRVARVAAVGRQYRVSVPAASAALVTIG
jgi:hypothetical protein